MNLALFLQIVQILEKAVPVGLSIVGAISQLAALLHPTHPDTGEPLTEAEVHAAVAGARTVWTRIDQATQPRPPVA